MKLISQGAEAKIYLTDNKIIKYRVKKQYRIRQIDDKLRRFRTKRETQVISKLRLLDFPSPYLIDSDNKKRIVIEYIKGDKIRDILSNRNYRNLIKVIAKNIAIMHNNHIIHGDLTTSNFIFNKEKNKVYFIDFGLSFFSNKIEDKAVDLHLLKQALESKHYRIWEKCFKLVLDTYKKECHNGEDIIKRLEKVEMRGRYKKKG
jgi:TP53 regulating kinase-like protein